MNWKGRYANARPTPQCQPQWSHINQSSPTLCAAIHTVAAGRGRIGPSWKAASTRSAPSRPKHGGSATRANTAAASPATSRSTSATDLRPEGRREVARQNATPKSRSAATQAASANRRATARVRETAGR